MDFLYTPSECTRIVPCRAIWAPFALLTPTTKDNIIYRKQKFMPLRFTYEEAWVYAANRWQVFSVFACGTQVYDTSLALINWNWRSFEINTVFIYEPTCHTSGNCHLSNEVAHWEFRLFRWKLLPRSAVIHAISYSAQRPSTSNTINNCELSSLLILLLWVLSLLQLHKYLVLS